MHQSLYLLLAADQLSWSEFSRRLDFKDRPVELWPFIVVLGVIVLFGIIVWIRSQWRPTEDQIEVQALFKRLQNIHALNDIESRTLKQFCSTLMLENPILIFIKPTLFQSCVDLHMRRLKTDDSKKKFQVFFDGLRKKIYG